MLPLLRLFTGISIIEACALTWGDISISYEDCKIKVYSLLVSGYIDTNRKYVSYAVNHNWIKFRKVPLCDFISEILISRKNYLLEAGIPESTIAQYPIITESDTLTITKNAPEFCSPGKASNICVNLIKDVRTISQTLLLPDDDSERTIDLYRYHGDIFTSTFKTRLNEISKIETNDINRLAGNQADSTIDNHYTAYEHPLIQLQLKQSIERWTIQYAPKKSETGNFSQYSQRAFSQSETVFPSMRDGTKVEMDFKNHSKENIEIILYADADFGFDAEFISFNEV